MTILLIPLIIVFALLGTPLFIVIAAGALLGFHNTGADFMSLPLALYSKIAKQHIFVTIPLFTFAGYLMAEAKTPTRLVNLSRACLGWLPGGFAVVAVVACAFFTAFTGASGVTIIALGGLLYPVLMKEQYPDRFSLGLLTTSGSRGLLFPPSLPIIVYGLIAEVKVDDLFVAGVVPGLLPIILFIGYCIFRGVRSDVPRHPLRAGEILKALWGAAWELPIPIIILGGIYGGFFTVIHASAVTAFYVLVVEVFIYRDIKLRQVPGIMRKSMVLVGGILIILASALGFTEYLIDEEVPMKIIEFMETFIQSPLAFLLLLNCFLLVVGCIMDIFSAILVVVPLIAPIAEQFGINPLHLGVIFLTNLEIGFSTPPVGINLFIASLRFQKPITTLYRAALPFLAISLASLLIITYVPDLSLRLIRSPADLHIISIKPEEDEVGPGGEVTVEVELENRGEVKVRIDDPSRIQLLFSAPGFEAVLDDPIEEDFPVDIDGAESTITGLKVYTSETFSFQVKVPPGVAPGEVVMDACVAARDTSYMRALPVEKADATGVITITAEGE
jgi:tripartite ATP-independent transporter DctM subunit